MLRAQLDDACRATGRDPATIDRIFLIGNTEDKPLVAIEAFVDFAVTYREIGFTDVVFHHPRTDDSVFDEDPAIVDQIAQSLDTIHQL